MKEHNYKLVWEDDFNSPTIDKNNWAYEIGYIRNNELQYYTDSEANSFIENGCLVIQGLVGEGDVKYTSASLNTYGKQSFLYGKIEMRAKLPFGKGIWPAFWTLGTNIREINWPGCGEIDIMELIGGKPTPGLHTGDHRIHGTIHYEKNGPNLSKSYELENKCFCDDFHIIGIDWTEEYIKWYVDEIEYYSVSIKDLPAFHKEQYILLNLAIGGAWPGSPDETTVFPQRYYIDWVRYYK